MFNHGDPKHRSEFRHIRDETFAQDWLSMFQESHSLDECEITDIEGKLPEDLVGTFWRNGPGTFARTKRSASVDGDGLIVRLTFAKDGRVFFKAKFVETQEYMEEQLAGRALYRGAFGSCPDEWILRGLFAQSKYKNAANTSQHYLEGKNQLMVMWEGDLPHLMNPHTLETLGTSDLDGTLENNRPSFSAHPCIDPTNGELVNFGLTFGRHTTISVTELKEGSGGVMQLLKRHRIRLPGMGAVIHSCSLTKNWIVFAHDPVKMNLIKMALNYSMDDWIEDDLSDNARTLYFVLPRFSSALKSPSILPDDDGSDTLNKRSVAIYSSAPSFSYHDVAAFEDPSTGDIVLDRIQYARKPPLLMESVEKFSSLGNAAGPGKLTRVTLRRPTCWGKQIDDSKDDSKDLKSNLKSSTRSISVRTLAASPSSCEMPVVSSRRTFNAPHRFVWSVDTARDVGPWTGICKSDLELDTCVTWRPLQERTFVGEPVFVSKERKVGEVEEDSHEDNGWLLILAFHAAESRSSVYVLDAKNMHQVCRLCLSGFVPWSHHCSWTSKVFHQQEVARSKM